MKASQVYSLDKDITPTTSRQTLIKEIDNGRYGLFLTKVQSMKSWPIKSYGKIETEYRIQAIEYKGDDEFGPIYEVINAIYYIKTRKEALELFTKFSI